MTIGRRSKICVSATRNPVKGLISVGKPVGPNPKPGIKSFGTAVIVGMRVLEGSSLKGTAVAIVGWGIEPDKRSASLEALVDAASEVGGKLE